MNGLRDKMNLVDLRDTLYSVINIKYIGHIEGIS